MSFNFDNMISSLEFITKSDASNELNNFIREASLIKKYNDEMDLIKEYTKIFENIIIKN